jgi:aminocarboxymuconate-semialdehyde decarboxylase
MTDTTNLTPSDHPAGGPVVDVHVHAVPARLVDLVRRSTFPEVSIIDDGSRRLEFPRMAPSPPPPAGLFDFDGIAGDGRKARMTTRLVGPWTDFVGYSLSANHAAAWANTYNEALVESCSDHATLEPLATAPLQAPDVAVAVLRHARDVGCKGIMIGSDIPGSSLGAASLDVFWEAAAELSLPVFLHPTFMTIPPILRQRGLKNAVARAGATAVAVADLIYAGVMERHPDVALIVAHGGGSFLHLLDRIKRNQDLGWADSDVDIEASVARLYWDSVVLSPAAVSGLVGTVGGNRVVLGSDYPFPWEPDPVDTVQAAGFEPATLAAILGGTASGLFDI